MVALAFCDVETVRLGTEHGPALWECAIILRDNSGDTTYLWQVRPNLEHAEARALQTGGYYERCRVADKPAGSGVVLAGPKLPKGRYATRQARLIATDMAKLLDGVLIVGANPWFDAGHIGAFLREHEQALAADYHLRDIGSVADGYIAGYNMANGNLRFCGHDVPPPMEGPKSGKLSDVAAAMGFSPADWDPHTALGDARLARALWDAVHGRPE